MFRLKNLEKIANAFPVIKVKSVSRRFFMAAAVSSVLISACDGGSGGSTGTGSKGESDTTPPGVMENLEAYASVNHGEEVRLRWVSSGDDAWTGSPDHFILAYSANPINSETDWQNGDILGTVNADGPAGTQYDMHLPCPAGDFYFSIKAVDEAGNKSPVSNSPNATIKSKAEFYVDAWFPNAGSVFLNYDEAVALIQGEVEIPSYVSDIAVELIKCSDPAWPGTQAQLEDFLLRYTNGIYDPGSGDGELHIAHDPWYLDDDGIGNPGVRLYFEPDGTSVNDFNNLPPDAVTNLRTIMKEFLKQYVDAHKEDYSNLDITHNPTWAFWD